MWGLDNFHHCCATCEHAAKAENAGASGFLSCPLLADYLDQPCLREVLVDPDEGGCSYYEADSAKFQFRNGLDPDDLLDIPYRQGPQRRLDLS